MVIQTDIVLRGIEWQKVIAAFSKFFTQRPRYDIFLLAASIGVLYDKRIEKLPDEDLESNPPSVPRNVFNNNSEVFDDLFQTAVLITSTIDVSDEERLQLAFGENNKEFDKKTFLVSFANFGITKLAELVAEDDLESADNLKSFLTHTLEGSNLDLDPLSFEDMEEGGFCWQEPKKGFIDIS